LKTYDIYKMIDENPDKMLDKKFKQIGGLVAEEFGIGDIAIVTPFANIIGLAYLKKSYHRIRLTHLSGFEEWELVQEPVTWEEAFDAWNKEGRDVRWEYQDNVVHMPCKVSCMLADFRVNGLMIARGKWYIEG